MSSSYQLHSMNRARGTASFLSLLFLRALFLLSVSLWILGPTVLISLDGRRILQGIVALQDRHIELRDQQLAEM